MIISKKMKSNRLRLALLIVLSLVLYYIAPNRYDIYYIYGCVSIFLISTYFYFKDIKKKNYFDFDTFFISSFFLVNFFFPIAVYPFGAERYFAFAYNYNEDVITRSTIIALIGIIFYYSGSVQSYFVNHKKRWNSPIINIRILYYFAILCFAVFLFTGGYKVLRSVYSSNPDAEKGVSGYIYILCRLCSLLLLIVVFHNSYCRNIKFFNPNKIEIKSLFYIVLFGLMVIITGSRTPTGQIIIVWLGLYSFYYKPINFRKTVYIGMIGIILLFLAMIYRSGGSLQIGSFSDVFADFFMNNRSLYLSTDIVDKEGVSYGLSLLGNLLAPIPFLQSIVFSTFNIDPIDAISSLKFTKESLGEVTTLGFGSNLIGDLYLGCGLIGVGLGMYFLGWIVHFTQRYCKTDMYCLVTYFMLFAYSVVMPRVEFFYVLRPLLWSLIIINIVKLHKLRITL